MFWKKKKLKVTTISFVKELQLDKDGWIAYYHTEKNGLYIAGSTSLNKDNAHKFFENLVKASGKNKIKETLESEIFIE
jgi:hypothetical protein